MRIAALALFFLATVSAAPQQPLSLWYRQPAAGWVEALPVGNGRLGAMVFGGISHERIQFNEDTVWTGAPHDYAHPGAYRFLEPIRRLLFAGKQAEAEQLAEREFMSVPLHQKAYQAFGDLLLEFPGLGDDGASAYRRELDLDRAVASVEYVENGVHFRREVFASWPAQVIVVRLSADRPASINVRAALKAAHKDAAVVSLSTNEIAMRGGVEDSAIRFEARLRASADGGRIEVDDGAIVVTGANTATLLLAGATNFKNFRDVSADPRQRNDSVLKALQGKDYDSLLREHVTDHQRLFRRVSLNLGGDANASKPTDERIRAFDSGDDPALAALLFQYGRYLLIASSREGGQPANLQGIWNAPITRPGTANTR